jgi:hypothetical protein
MVARAGNLSLVRAQGGLLIDSPFGSPLTSTQIQRSYELNGSAPAADRFISADASGLHVGVREHAPGQFEGYFAATRRMFPPTSVFHVHMARMNLDIPGKDGSGEAVFAVQTGTTKQSGLINYVVVASSTYAGLTHWLVGYAHGRIASSTTDVLWQGPYLPTAQADLAEDVTLTTDGYRSLAVWFGPKEVYSSDHLDMDIPAPFQCYLEVQAMHLGYVATFTGFHVEAGPQITVVGVPLGQRLTFVPSAGPAVVATASTSGKVVVKLPLPGPTTGTATIRLGEGDQLGPFPYTGGDVLRLVKAK